MCGINGIYGKVADAQGRVQAMNEALAHRGPDAHGIWQGEGIALGHQRLSIIDLSAAANQPMHDPSGRYTLVYNGEVYNFVKLREQIADKVSAAGWEFKTHCDTEVLLFGLALYGPTFLSRCNGMFALAFWDAEERRLILGRDRLGIKPLYYARTNEHLCFSSEMRALMRSGLTSKSLSTRALADYLRYQTVHGDNTIVDQIKMLPAGTYLTVDEHDEIIKTWWHPVLNTSLLRSNAGYEDATAMVRSTLSEAVSQRLVADVPFGAFLSGGIDSSSIVALASEAYTGTLQTFTVTFDDTAHNEARYARVVAERFGTRHTEVHLSAEAFLKSLPQALAAMDHPGGDGINTYVVSKAAKEAGITMVLSGLGGDELFAGYPIFKQVHELQQKKWLLSYPKFARSWFGSLNKMMKPGVASAKIASVITEDYFDTEYAYQYAREVYSLYDVQAMLARYEGGGNEVFSLVQEGVGYGNEGFRLPLLSRVSFAEMATYLQSVLLRDSDHMAMAHALEIRVPFLDHKLVELMLGMPDAFKYPTTPKKMLTDAMAGLLPGEIANRPKMGFTFPWDQWMRGELKDFCASHMHALASRHQFNEKVLLRKWDSFLNGHPEITWSRIWYLCALEAWLQRNEVS